MPNSDDEAVNDPAFEDSHDADDGQDDDEAAETAAVHKFIDQIIESFAKAGIQIEDLRRFFLEQMKETGKQAQPRLALVAILNEFIMLDKRGRYESAHKIWVAAASYAVSKGLILNHAEAAASPGRRRKDDGVAAPGPEDAKLAKQQKQNREARLTNFRNFVQRHSRGGRSWDVLEAALLIQMLTVKAGEDKARRVLDTLTPYQQYVLDWSKQILSCDPKRRPDIKLQASPGFEETKAPAESMERKLPTLWNRFAADLYDRDDSWPHWRSIFAHPTVKQEACFVLFRNGMEEHSYVAQTYLSIERREPGVHTYVHVYKFRLGGDKRITRGFVVPTDNMLFLIGGQAPLPPEGQEQAKPKKEELNVDLSRPLEIIALPINSATEPSLHRGLTITTNEKSKLLAARISVRRTRLAEDGAASTATYPRKDLLKQLRLIGEAEAKLRQEDVSENFESLLRIEAEAILQQINNRAALEIADLIKGGQTVSGDDLLRTLNKLTQDLFMEDGGATSLKDVDGRLFDERLHLQMRSLSTE